MADLKQLAIQAAKRYNVPVNIFLNMITKESGWNPRALSPKGAAGLGQLMPDTARSLGVTDPYDPVQNLDASAKYFRHNIDAMGGNIPYAVAGYNAGPGAVKKYGGIPPYAETQDYVSDVMGGKSGITGTLDSGSNALGPLARQMLEAKMRDVNNQQPIVQLPQAQLRRLDLSPYYA